MAGDQNGMPSTARGMRTRGALLAAGQALFAEHPFDAVAIDDVVQAASVAKGSFYTHFASKEALLAALITDIRQWVEAEIITANGGMPDPASRLARAICVNLRLARSDRERAILLLRNEHAADPSASLALYADAADDMAAGMAAGRFTLSSIESGLILMVGAGRLLAARAASDLSKADLHMLALDVCALVLRGLGLAADEAAAIAATAIAAIL